MAFTFATNLAGDGELSGVFSILAKQVREETSTGIDEPVTYLGKDGGVSRINKTDSGCLHGFFMSQIQHMREQVRISEY